MKFIKNKIEKWHSSLKNRYDVFFLENDHLETFVFGKKMRIKVFKENNRKRISIKFHDLIDSPSLKELSNTDQTIEIKIPPNAELRIIKRNFYNTFFKNYQSFYWNEVKKIVLNYQIKKEWSLVFKDLRGSWGLCKNTNNEIVLAKKLIHYPYEIQHYVIVHEVAHILVPNHSKSFWQMVAQQSPNFRDLRKRLRW